jgi:hypothetical protein
MFVSVQIPASKYLKAKEDEEELEEMNDQTTVNKILKSMRNELENLKKEMFDLKNDNTKMKIEINALKNNNDELNKKIIELSAVPARTPLTGYSSALKFHFPPLNEANTQFGDMEVDKVSNKRSREFNESFVEPTTSRMKKPTVQPVIIEETSKKELYKPIQDKKKVTKTIGNKADDEFLVVEKKRYFPVYMGRVSKLMTNLDVRSYLDKKNIGAYDVEQLNTEKHDRFKSFKFKIPYDRKDIIFDASVWTKGLLLRKFLSPRNDHLNDGVLLVNLPTDSNTASTK